MDGATAAIMRVHNLGPGTGVDNELQYVKGIVNHFYTLVHGLRNSYFNIYLGVFNVCIISKVLYR